MDDPLHYILSKSYFSLNAFKGHIPIARTYQTKNLFSAIMFLKIECKKYFSIFFCIPFVLVYTMGNLKKKELHLPSPHTKTYDLFWADLPKLHLSDEQKGAIWDNLAKLSHGFSWVKREDVILFSKFPTVHVNFSIL